MNYNSSGELWFISKQTWTGNDCPPEGLVTESIHEFRTNGRIMRLTRERDPATVGGSWLELPGTTQWHDFDGVEAYADSSVGVAGGGPISFTPLAAREPGLGMKDMQTGNTSYFHGDQIGSLRAVTDTPAGVPSVTGRIVHTAFGERVWSDGTIGTRHQYAGAWGYDTMPEFSSGMSPNFGGAAGDEVPFVHVGHRWYDPASGRFLQRDPIGLRGGFNLYSYVDNRPVYSVDPRGLDKLKDSGFWLTIGGAVESMAGGCVYLAGGVAAGGTIAAGGAVIVGFGAICLGVDWIIGDVETGPKYPPPPVIMVPRGPSETRTDGVMRPVPPPPIIIVPPF